MARHVVLVTIDTLRADHVGAYGSDVATPHLDQLARQGALVEQAWAHVPLTRPSHVSLFAGLLPWETGVRDNVSPTVIPDVPLLAEVLTKAGFETAAFVSSVVVSAASGLDRGFGLYSDEFEVEPGDPRFLNRAQKRGDETLAEAMAWLEDHSPAQEAPSAPKPPEEDGSSRLFLWLHLYDPHEPYEPPEPYASRYVTRPYAGEVAWTDELIGRLVAVLERLGLSDTTLLVVTSDHGEGLGEHGEFLHGFFTYESTLRVPLILRGPGVRPGTRLAGVVALVDLYPTILELASVPLPAGAEPSGRSLAQALRGGPAPPDLPLYAESLVPRLRFGWSELRVVRQGSWKYIQAPRPELYDLASDPAESHNLLGPRPSGEARTRARALRQALDAILAREHAAGEAEVAALPQEFRDKLQALGYLGGSESASTATPGADPKDKISEFRLANALMREGLTRLRKADYPGSEAKFRALLERRIESAEIHLYLGQSLLRQGRLAAAADHLLQATQRTPILADAWLGLAEARGLLGDSAGAVETLRDAQAFLPRQASLRREEARSLRLLGKPAEARQALEAALEIAPGNAFLRAALAEVLRELDDLDGAIERLQQAVELEPAGAKYWNALGMTLGSAGRFAEAEDAFRQAWRLDPADHRHAYNLGLALVRQGRSAAARPLFESTLELRPDFQPARDRLSEVAATAPNGRP